MKNQIEQLKRAKNAVILAHYYAPDEIQEMLSREFVATLLYIKKNIKICRKMLLPT